jgi:hypothetical protein
VYESTKAKLPDRTQRALGFLELTPSLAAYAAKLSSDGPVAYIHSETFGGSGFQAAVVWRAGDVVFGPCFTATDEASAENSSYEVVGDMRAMAINEALRFLGVVSREGDEFGAIGLDRRRFTDDWT